MARINQLYLSYKLQGRQTGGEREEPRASFAQGTVLAIEKNKRGMIRTSIAATNKYECLLCEGIVLIDLHVQLI